MPLPNVLLLSTGVPVVDFALTVAGRVYASYELLSKNYADANHTLNHIKGVAGIVRQVAGAGLAGRLKPQITEVCKALDDAEDAANAALPLAREEGSSWMSGIWRGTKRFAFSGTICQALIDVNDRLGRAIQLLQASLAVDTKQDTVALREAQARIEQLEREHVRLQREQLAATAGIQQQLKGIVLAGSAAGAAAAPQYSARRIEWSEIKFDKDDDDERIMLGSGSFGIVYAAKWRGEPVAVKTMSVKGASAKVIRDFWREACIQASLKHDHIVSCLGGAERVDKKTQEVLEVGIIIARMSGTTLEHWRAASPTPPLVKRIKALCEAAVALRFMHALEIIHGDIKPANIMLDELQRARIADLGTSRSVHAGSADASTLKRAIGTPRYIDPALARGGSLALASDVYSFAIMTWEVLVNEPAFKGFGADDHAIVKHAAAGGRPDVNDLPIAVASAVRPLLIRAWHQEQSMRPSMEQLVEELERVKVDEGLMSEGMPARPAGPKPAHLVSGSEMPRQMGGGESRRADLPPRPAGPKPAHLDSGSKMPNKVSSPRLMVTKDQAIQMLVKMKEDNSKDYQMMVAFLNDFAADASVCEKALWTLWWNRSSDQGEANSIDSSAPAAIVAAMQNHARSEVGVAHYGCRALSVIAFNETGKEATIYAHAPAAIVSAMLQHADSQPDVAKYGCWALANIAGCDAGRRAAVDVHAPAAVVAAMARHAVGIADVAKYGCMALLYFAVIESGCKAAVESRALIAIVAAMRKHAESCADVAKYGCGALSNIAFRGECTKAAVDALAPAAIVAAMRKHAGSNADVAHNCCSALANIATIEAGQKAAVKLLAPAAIVVAMRAHSDNAAISRIGCFALCNITAIEAGRSSAVEASAPATIVSAMRHHANSNADVAKYGCKALSNIAAHETGKKATLDALAPAAIVDAMRKHAGSNEDVARYGCMALCYIAYSEAGKTACIDADCKQVVIDAMKSQPVSKEYGESFMWACGFRRGIFGW